MAGGNAHLSGPTAAPALAAQGRAARPRARALATRLALLALVVLALHALALEWLARRAMTEASALRPVIDPMFTRVLKPAAPPEPAPQAAAPQPEAATPARPAISAITVMPQAPPAKPKPKPKPKAKPPQAQASAPAPAPAPVAAASAPAQETVAGAPANDTPGPAVPASAAAAASAVAGGDGSPAGAAPAAPAVAAAPEAPSSPASGVASDASSPASAPTASASAAAPGLDSWPADTRLNYVLGGEFRGGPLYGSARVQWQRQGPLYQTRLEIDVSLAPTRVMTSQGDVTQSGLLPRAYEETYGSHRRSVRLNDADIVMSDGRVLARPEGVQDTASQFVELGHRFASGREKLAVGQAVSVWLARPGGLDLWVYDVTERETLRTPRYGELEAFRLRPRAIAKPRGNITAEIWFAPSLQYLPVRIRVSMGSEAFVDLMVDTIEQR